MAVWDGVLITAGAMEWGESWEETLSSKQGCWESQGGGLVIGGRVILCVLYSEPFKLILPPLLVYLLHLQWLEVSFYFVFFAFNMKTELLGLGSRSLATEADSPGLCLTMKVRCLRWISGCFSNR